MSLGAGMVKRLITVRIYQWCVFISPRVVSGDNQIIFKLCWKLTNIDFKYEMLEVCDFIKSVGDSEVEILNDELS